MAKPVIPVETCEKGKSQTVKQSSRGKQPAKSRITDESKKLANVSDDVNPSLAKSSSSKNNRQKRGHFVNFEVVLRTEQLNTNKKLEAYGHRLDQIENYEYCDEDDQYDEMYQEQGSEFGGEDTRSVSDVTAGVKVGWQ
ncbi:hypothetical protein DPMN_082338 [Dreissena polymorpha]|uniref:Uncharacterized protein n=1 Tax=Dreissena polymorpha TaxID=45954 RepID=A0A9D4BA20_DREPO|nr:hypothetical protein DPMN_082338 [Dreissena polymorpha]